MHELKLKLTDSRYYDLGFEIKRKMEISYDQFDILSQKLVNSFKKILEEFS